MHSKNRLLWMDYMKMGIPKSGGIIANWKARLLKNGQIVALCDSTEIFSYWTNLHKGRCRNFVLCFYRIDFVVYCISSINCFWFE